MNIFLGLLGMLAGIAMIKFREPIGEMFENSDWTKYFGGPYNFIIVVGILMFFFSLAKMTGTAGFFLSPLRLLFPFLPGG